MAYAAAVYLLQTLQQLQQSDQFSTTHYPKSQIHHLTEKISSLKDFLEKNSSLEDNSESTILESQIRDAIYEAEDIIESHISTRFLSSGSASSGEDSDLQIFCKDLHRVIQNIDSVAEKTTKFTVQVGHDLIHTSLPANRVSSRHAPHPEDIMVGRYHDINILVERLTGSTLELEVVPIVGISGVGKTTLAKAVYNDPSIKSEFDIPFWINLSLIYNKRDLVLHMTRYLGVVGSGKREVTDDELEEYLNTLGKYLNGLLETKKYLIVLDDICFVEAWNILKQLLPDSNNGSRVVLTTRNVDVAHLAKDNRPLHEVHLLEEHESWDLLRQIVFVNKLSPPELEQIAKNIAVNCRGLPLAIVKIGRVLAEATITGWQTVASSISTCKNNDELIEVVLSLNYRSLSQHLKACLLYMGIFPPSYEIPVSKLIKLWIAEGFLELKGSETLEKMAEKILLQLADRSLVTGCKKSSNGRIKTCMIGDVYRDFVKRKAEEEKFFCVINKHTKEFLEDIHAQRRLCIPKNICFGTKDLRTYNSEPWVSTARSLLYSGPVHQHQLRVWLNFKLLRVLDALNICFYTLPLEVLNLVQLRYLAFTYNGELPTSICKLQNLQFLIVLRNLSTKRCGHLLHLPKNIWNMKELRHLQVMGRDLLDPLTLAGGGSILGNLLTLLDVSSHSCTRGVLQRIPNVKKLGIRIESLALDAAENFSFLSHLVILRNLESLKCVVMHPDFSSRVVPSVPAFPPNLTKLCLSGCGFSWKCMKVISKLQNLEVLKLQSCSFRGPNWELNKEVFVQLKFLLLEDMDVAKWIASGANFPSLARLIIRHCYKLRKIPYGIGEIMTLEMIEADDCNPSVVNSVIRILKLQRNYGNYGLQVCIPSSWSNHKFRTF